MMVNCVFEFTFILLKKVLNSQILEHGFEVLMDTYPVDLYDLENSLSLDDDKSKEKEEKDGKPFCENNTSGIDIHSPTNYNYIPNNPEKNKCLNQEEDCALFSSSNSILYKKEELIDSTIYNHQDMGSNYKRVPNDRKEIRKTKIISLKKLSADLPSSLHHKKHIHDIKYFYKKDNRQLSQKIATNSLTSDSKSFCKKKFPGLFTYNEVHQATKAEFSVRYKRFQTWDIFSRSVKDGIIFEILTSSKPDPNNDILKASHTKYDPELNYVGYIKSFYLRKSSDEKILKDNKGILFFKMGDFTNEIEKFFSLKKIMTDVEIIQYLVGVEEERALLENFFKKNASENSSVRLEIFEIFTKLQQNRFLRFILPEYLAFETLKNFDFFKILFNQVTTEYDYLTLIFMHKLTIFLSFIKNISYENNNNNTIQRFLTFRFLFRQLLLKNMVYIWKFSFYIIYSNINLHELRSNLTYRGDTKFYLTNENISFEKIHDFDVSKRYNMHSIMIRLLFVNSLKNILPERLYAYENLNNMVDFNHLNIILDYSNRNINYLYFYKVYLERGGYKKPFFNYITRFKYQTCLFLQAIESYNEILLSNPFYYNFTAYSDGMRKLLNCEIFQKGFETNKKHERTRFYVNEVELAINYVGVLYAFEFKYIPKHIFE